MGLDLKSPLVISASPLSNKIENIVAMQEAGAGAVVMFSLFEEQIKQENVGRTYISTQSTHGSVGAENHFFDTSTFHVKIDEYLH